MLSLGKVATGVAAAAYYEEADDYYHRDSAPSRWWGSGAEALELRGRVQASMFRDLLDGKMLDGSEIHNAAEGRRGGTDFTFSAPKSISMQALIGGDTRLIDAHESAVTRALDYAESVATYRATESGITHSQQSHNVLVAMFRHDLSRALDPNLHTHAVMINATQRPDGKWRALEQTEFYRQQKLIGALYRSELALEVQKLGYETRLTHDDGRFELAHIHRAQIEAFSTRSQAIEVALAEQGKTREDASAHQKEITALATRDQKDEIDRQALRENWRERSDALSVNFQPILQPQILNTHIRDEKAREALLFAVEHGTERQSIISGPQILRSALEHGTGQTNLAAIRNEIARAVGAGELIQAADRFTTPQAQDLERALLALEQRGRGALAPLYTKEPIANRLMDTSLNADQSAAAELVLTTDARICAIQGSAGTGKTTMLRTAREFAAQQGYQLRGLAPSAAAARELNSAGIISETIAAFNKRENPGLHDKIIIVLDEAGMVPTRDMLAVLTKAEDANARVVLVGDIQQLKAVEAGKPFAQLQEHGIARVEMGDIQRQRDLQLKNAVELAAQGEITKSISVLERHIHEIESPQQRYATIARDYASLDPMTRENTLLVAGTHSARAAINERVRQELGLAGQGIEVTILERKDLTAAQARSSLSYSPGEIVRANRAYESLGLERGALATVVDSQSGRVTLRRADGVQVNWRPTYQTDMTSFYPHSRELAVGDRVWLTANDYAAGIINGDRASVKSIENERLILHKADGSEIALDTKIPLYLEHGYCSTVHAAQGQTADRVLIEADTHSMTANESSYYVAISRARDSATIYTDDKQLLPAALAREDFKAAALEIQKVESVLEMAR